MAQYYAAQNTQEPQTYDHVTTSFNHKMTHSMLKMKATILEAQLKLTLIILKHILNSIMGIIKTDLFQNFLS
jgi:hypothetical protein